MTDLPDGSVLERAARWHRVGGHVYGRLYATGGVFVAAEGPEEHGVAAAEALARSWRLAEPTVHTETFLDLMQRQGVPRAKAEVWLRTARVTDDQTFLTWFPRLPR